MNVNHLIGVIIVWVMCIFTWAIVSYPVTAQTPKVEVEPTAYLLDATTVNVAHSKVGLQMIRFRDGTVCVVGSVYQTSRFELQCDFTRSSTVQKQ